MDLQAQRAFYDEIRPILEAEYGWPEWKPRHPAVDELVLTILSQNTNDTNSSAAYENLREVFPSWAQVRDVDAEEIAEAIKVAGLSNQKAPRIQNALRTITQERGELSLDFLAEMSVEDAKKWLKDLKGVGPKTAAIVLLFSLGMPAFPVDTHIYRVTRRIGLIAEDISYEKAHDLLEEIVPEEHYFPFHIDLIRHGRALCHARSPECERCPLQNHCEYYALEAAQES